MKWNIPGRFRSLLFLAAKEDGTRADAVGGLQTTRAAAEWRGDLGPREPSAPAVSAKVGHDDPQGRQKSFSSERPSPEICATTRARTQGQ
jgi:hypothetical protein